MKTLLLALVVFTSALAKAQITQVHTSPASLSTVCLNGLYKYYYVPADGNSVVLLNGDYSNYKTISIPWPSNHQWSSKSIISISSNYFTTDGSVSLIAWGYSGSYFGYVFNENGNILLSADSAMINQTSLIAGNNVVAGVSVLHLGVNKNVDYYSVPGTSCTTCEWSCAPVTGLLNPGEDNNTSLEIYPNPAINEVNLHYQLPQGATQGDISTFTIDGKFLKKIHVTGNQGTIQDSAQPAGVYIYQLSTAGGNVIKKQFFTH